MKRVILIAIIAIVGLLSTIYAIGNCGSTQ